MQTETTPLIDPVDTLPPHLRTTFGRVTSLIVVFICCAIAAGPLSGFPSLIPLLIHADVFAGVNQLVDFSNVYSISMAIVATSFFFTGIAYDKLGAQRTCTLGSILVATGFVASWVGIKYESLNSLLYFSFPWTYFWGLFNSFGLYGFIPVFPSNATLVVGIANSSFLISSVMAYVFLGLTKLGLTLDIAFLIFAGLCIVDAVVIYVFTPSNLVCAKLSPPPPTEQQNVLVDNRNVLKALWKEFNHNRTANLIFLGWIAITFPFVVVFTSNLYQYYELLVGHQYATDLSTAYSIIFAIVGAVGSPLLGALSDRIGMKNMMIFINSGLVLFTCLVFIPIVEIQYFTMVILTLTYSAVILASPQWALSYVSPNLFGSYLGVQLLVAGIVQILLTFVIPPIMRATGVPGIWFYVVPYAIMLGITFILGIILVLYLTYNPKPNSVVVLNINE